MNSTFDRLLQALSTRPRRPRPTRRRRGLSIEPLEHRRLLASDLAAITGTVFDDMDNDGTVDAGESGLSGISVQLTGTDDQGSVGPLTAATDGAGSYRFDDLRAGTYQLTQLAAPSGFSISPGASPVTVVISDAQSDGQPGLNIDTFNTSQSAVAGPNSTDSDSFATSAAVGGQRDLFVESSGNAGMVEIFVNTATAGRADFGAVGAATGSRTITWDGLDNDATVLDFTGLGGVQLSNGGDFIGVALDIGVLDPNPGTGRLRVYTDSTNFSEAVFQIPPIGAAPSLERVVLEFTSDFTNAGASGGANFDNVGAMQLEVDVANALDAQVDFIAAIGPTVIPQNFANRQIIPSIDIEKSTNGQDADTQAVAPEISVGDTVTWTYVVTNNGNVDLTNVRVNDDRIGAVTDIINQGDGDGTLAVDESWTYQATGTAQTGNYENLGTVTADDPTSTQVNDTDLSHYFGVDSRINIEKGTNGQDADLQTAAPDIAAGNTVTWTYVVTNTGNVDLTNVQVNDDQIGTVTTITNQGNGDSVLDAGESWTYQATGTAQAGNYENRGTVTADDPTSTQVTDTDPSHYFGVDSRIDIEKATNGQDADTQDAAPKIAVGDAVTWTYVVANTGNVDLTNVQVNDNQIGAVTNITNQGDGNSVLEVGESWTYQAAGSAQAGNYENRGTVTADDRTDAPVTDSDLSHYFGRVTVSSISGFVYLDFDNDAVKDSNDLGLEGVTVALLQNNVVLRTETTDNRGFYLFDDLQPGDYTIVETQPARIGDGKDTPGGTPGDPLGSVTANDELFYALGHDEDAEDFNFGEILSKRRWLSSS